MEDVGTRVTRVPYHNVPHTYLGTIQGFEECEIYVLDISLSLRRAMYKIGWQAVFLNMDRSVMVDFGFQTHGFEDSSNVNALVFANERIKHRRSLNNIDRYSIISSIYS